MAIKTSTVVCMRCGFDSGVTQEDLDRYYRSLDTYSDPPRDCFGEVCNGLESAVYHPPVHPLDGWVMIEDGEHSTVIAMCCPSCMKEVNRK